jgi:CMP-N,N'-diacetyllegionaminic acid synthase
VESGKVTLSRKIAIIPARSGSTGLKNKNVLVIKGKTLIEHAIEFARKLEVDDIICSTDSEEYALIAKNAGARIVDLRSKFASSGTAMEEDVINDLNLSFQNHSYQPPEVAVWLRPTFLFRSLSLTKSAIDNVASGMYTASRIVTEIDPRLYTDANQFLVPIFDDQGKSMMRRQGLTPFYKVFNTDVFVWPTKKCPENFLGNKIDFKVAPKLCSFDIDDLVDFQIVEALMNYFNNNILD